MKPKKGQVSSLLVDSGAFIVLFQENPMDKSKAPAEIECLFLDVVGYTSFACDIPTKTNPCCFKHDFGHIPIYS